MPGENVSKAGGMTGAKGIGPGSSRSLRRGIAIVLILVGAALALGPTILDAAGRFLAPRSEGKAEAVIIEGEELLQQGTVAEALRLMTDRRVERLILVTHRYSEARMGLGISRRYERLLDDELQRLGLRKGQYILVSVPVSHPITLTEARAVLAVVTRESIQSAILLSSGFHTRRSYLLYKDIGRTQGIQIIPWSSSVNYPLREWWRHEDAVSDFVAQLAKLGYYLFRGYIPISSLFQNP